MWCDLRTFTLMVVPTLALLCFVASPFLGGGGVLLGLYSMFYKKYANYSRYAIIAVAGSFLLAFLGVFLIVFAVFGPLLFDFLAGGSACV